MHAEKRTFDHRTFWLVRLLQLRRTQTGAIEEYRHSISEGIRLNAYAQGPFCYFSLPPAPRASGVYAVTVNRELKYIGECENLADRFGSKGYGSISPRNLHHDGQSTNCKLNNLIPQAARNGQPVEVWFHQSKDRKADEAILLSQLKPVWNGRYAGKTKSVAQTTRSRKLPSGTATQKNHAATAPDFRRALDRLFRDAERRAEKLLIVQAGHLHRIVGGYPGNHRMPTCCNVMRSYMRDSDRFRYQPPKGDGARLEIEYRLPRDPHKNR